MPSVIRNDTYPPYSPVARHNSVSGIYNGGSQPADFTTANHAENAIFCSRLLIKQPGYIDAIALPLEAAPTSGAGSPARTLLLGLYEVDIANGQPTRLISPGSFEWQLTASAGFRTQVKVLTSRIKISQPQHLILACRIPNAAFATGKAQGFLPSKVGNSAWTRAGDFSAAVAGSTYASGLPSSWSSLSSPTYTDYDSTSGGNLRICSADWILYMSPE